jgi:hypothetical protein
LTCGTGIVSLDQFIWLLAANRFCDTEFPDPNIVYWMYVPRNPHHGMFSIKKRKESLANQSLSPSRPSGAVISLSYGIPGGFSITITLSLSTISFPFFEPITQATCNAYFANSIDAMSQDCLFDNGWQDTSPVLLSPFYPFDTDGTIS